MRYSIVRLLPLAVILSPAFAEAQVYSDFCPEHDPDLEAAVVGYVTDPDADTLVPGAKVAASWVQDGARQRREGQASVEGLYAVCGIPMGTEVQLRATFADLRGSAVSYTASEMLAQRDLELSLTGGNESETVETGSMAKGSSGNAYNSSVIREADLVNLPEMSVYQLLRQHSRLRFDRLTGGGEVILLNSGVSTSLNGGRFTGVQVYINERREGDAVTAVRGMSIDEIKRIEILSSGEASARYGGDGWIGAIAITTRDR